MRARLNDSFKLRQFLNFGLTKSTKTCKGPMVQWAGNFWDRARFPWWRRQAALGSNKKNIEKAAIVESTQRVDLEHKPRQQIDANLARAQLAKPLVQQNATPIDRCCRFVAL